MPELDDTRLNDLKQRWASDPGSRLYLQLADEHRKRGQLTEAEAVLERGLENRPSDLSGLVALGRIRLELAKVESAIESLEVVIGRDPAHMVANKLLIEAHLQQGDAEKAGGRLDIYRLLNDRDPELEHLDYRLRQLRAPDVESWAGAESDEVHESPEELAVEEAVVRETPETFAAETAVPPVIAAPANGDEIFHLGSVPPAPDFGTLWRKSARVRWPREPFPGLSAGASLVRGDIFRIAPAMPPAMPAPKPLPALEPTQTDPTLETRKTEVTSPTVEPEAAIGEAAEELEIEVEPAVDAELEDDDDEERTAKIAVGRFWGEPSSEPVDESTAKIAVGDDRRDQVLTQPSAVEAVTQPSAVEAVTQPSAVEAVRQGAETVALGRLYLKQGHFEEAARIFRKILEQDPDSQAARAGLGLTRKPQKGEPLTAIELLADRSLSGTIPAGLTGKKILVLTNYLRRLRGAAERSDVH